MAKIAFLGLGSMGSRMANRLILAGHTLTVYNRNASKADTLKEMGARIANSPESAVKDVEFIFSMLTDDEASREVWLKKNSAIHNIGSGQVVIECSTVSPAWVKELAGAVEQKNAHFIECPVAGSRLQAETGKLICFLGGKSDVAAKIADVLKPLAEATHLVGDVGSGSVFKLVANGYFIAQIVALKEVMDVAKKSGLNPKLVNEIFQTLPATSPALKGILQLVAAGNIEPRFTISLAQKDLRYLLDLSTQLRADDNLFRQSHQYFEAAVKAGQGDKNVSGIVN